MALVTKTIRCAVCGSSAVTFDGKNYICAECGTTSAQAMPAADLAAVVAIASSYLDKPVPSTMAAIGEVGLSGEIRSITHMEQRLSEVKRLGFTQCMVPAHKVKDLKAPVGLELLPVANISRALQLLARGQ